jgi:DHA2 family multidrug resistance protein-like MFS transporter
MATSTLLVTFPFRMQHDFGFRPEEVGALIVPWPLTMMVVSPLAGALSDRVPAGLLGGIGMAVATTGLVMIALLPPDPSWFDIAWRMSLSGTGFGLFLSPNARLIIGSAPRDRAASAGGLIATTRIAGQTIGATAAAILLALALPGRFAPLVSASLAVVAGLCSIARLRPSIRQPHKDELPEPMGTIPPPAVAPPRQGRRRRGG